MFILLMLILILKTSIFIQNYKGETIYGISENKGKLIDIVTRSYFNLLSSKNLVIDWEIKCSFIKNNDLKSYVSKIKSDNLEKLRKAENRVNLD